MFDTQGNATKTQKASQIVIQQVDENGRLLSEKIYFKELKPWVQSAF